MSQSPDVQDTSSEEDIEELTLPDIITLYLRCNPTPSDEQFRELAAMLDIPYASLEEEAYRMFSDMVGEAADEAEAENEDDQEGPPSAEDVADDLVDDDEDVDSKDLFIISFFLYHPNPTDQQIILLCKHLSISPEQLEDRMLELMGEDLATEELDD